MKFSDTKCGSILDFYKYININSKEYISVFRIFIKNYVYKNKPKRKYKIILKNVNTFRDNACVMLF